MSTRTYIKIIKLHSVSEINKVYEHNYRINETPNSNQNKEDFEEMIYKNKNKTFIERIEEKYEKHDYKFKNNHGTKTVRKDGVKCYEILTRLPKSLDGKIDINEWKREQMKFIMDTFGKDNILSAMYHGDENVPHCHFVVTPITKDGRLCAKDFTDGRAKMSIIQDNYAKAMKKFGIERGVRGHKMNYQKIKQMYEALDKIYDNDIFKPLERELYPDYIKRIDEIGTDLNLKAYKLEQQNQILESQNQILQKTINDMNKNNIKILEEESLKKKKELEKIYLEKERMQKEELEKINKIMEETIEIETCLTNGQEYNNITNKFELENELENKLYILKRNLDKIINKLDIDKNTSEK